MSATATSSPAKFALVIPAEDRLKPIGVWSSFMADRAHCETDKSTLQVLPYIALIDENNNLFVYTRGKAGQESRLHNKKSVGLGGHIDEPVTTTIEELIIDEATREVEEETGYKPTREQMQEALKNAAILYAPVNDVDAVHIAVMMMISVKRSDLTKLEDGVIVNPEWLSNNMIGLYREINKLVKPECQKWEFETWTKYFLGFVEPKDMGEGFLRPAYPEVEQPANEPALMPAL